MFKRSFHDVEELAVHHHIGVVCDSCHCITYIAGTRHCRKRGRGERDREREREREGGGDYDVYIYIFYLMSLGDVANVLTFDAPDSRHVTPVSTGININVCVVSAFLKSILCSVAHHPLDTVDLFLPGECQSSQCNSLCICEITITSSSPLLNVHF